MSESTQPISQIKLHSRLFKNRKGNIRKIVREHYLRSDVYCGSQVCSSCRRAFRRRQEEDGMDLDDLELMQLVQAEALQRGMRLSDDDDDLEVELSSAGVLSDAERRAFPLGRNHPSHLPGTAEEEGPVMKRRRRNSPAGAGEASVRTRYVIPDASFLLHQIDLLETGHELFQGIIYLQSTLQFLRHQDFRLYERLRRLQQGLDLTEEDRKSLSNYVFTDLHHPGTYVMPKPGEAEQDYTRACVISAVKWYAEHLQSEGVEFVLLTHLPKVFQTALQGLEDVVTVIAPADYVASEPELVDLVAKVDENSEAAERGTKSVRWEAHLSKEEINAGLADGTLLRAKFRHRRYTEGYAVLKGGAEILLPSAEAINRAVHGDRIIVRILPPEQWKSPEADLIKEEEEEGEESSPQSELGTAEDRKEEEEVESAEEQAAGVMDAYVVEDDAPILETDKAQRRKLQEEQAVIAGKSLAELRELAPKGSTPTGEVVAVEQRSWGTYAGTLELTDRTEGWCLFIPMNRQIPKVRIESSQIAQLMDKRILVRIDSWPSNSRYPHGHYVKTLGPIGDPEAEMEVILHEHDIPHGDWTPEILRCLPPLDYEITPEEIQGRMDLRELLIFSIDPPGCTDIDDALHCRPLENGNLEVGVHIADVTHYVRPGTALDTEASNRCTSTYLVNTRLDMLPAHLSSNLCSLMEGVDRLAFSVVWEMDRNAEVKDIRVHKSVIRSVSSIFPSLSSF